MNKLKRWYALERWLALGLSGAERGTSALLRLSALGVLLCLLVMLISVSVSLGFKREVRSFAVSQTGHISLYPAGGDPLSSATSFKLTSELKSILSEHPEVSALHPLVQQRAMLKTRDDYAGIMLLGLDSAQSHPYFIGRMQEGVFPSFSSLDTVANPIVLPSRLAERMQCHLGDKLQVYFLHREVRVRSFRVVGIYDASGLEQLPALCASRVLRAVDRLGEDAYHRLAIELHHPDYSSATLEVLAQQIEQHPEVLGGQVLQLSSAEQIMPELFGWLELLDSNVYVLLGLMLLVGGFTMISGLLILVLDKTQHIGLLKALGATDAQIRRVFILLSMRLALWSMLAGNVLFALIYFLQRELHLLRLDPRNYYVDFVPMHLEMWHWVAINLATLLAILLALLLPSRLSGRVDPSEAMRFE